MKKTWIILIVFFPTVVFTQLSVQWSDDFSDGDFIHNPVWSGMKDNFIVNGDSQLQSNVATTSKSYLSTGSEVFDEAVWEFWVRINNTTSNQNYSLIYIISDRADISGSVNGYYVMIGNTEDEISLYKQQGNKKTKIIDGADKTIDTNPVVVKIKVTRSKEGLFSLFRQRQSTLPEFNDTEYIQEGESVTDTDVLGSKFFGLLYANSSANGKNYFFDNIHAAGSKLLDSTPPEWLDLRIEEPDKMVLTFSEAIDITSAEFIVDHLIGNPVAITLSEDQTTVTLAFDYRFEKGTIYTLQTANIKDVAGNSLQETTKHTGISETAEVGDLVINEVLFDVPADGAEYIEVFNSSNKVIDLSNLFFATRNANNGFSTSNLFPKGLLYPQAFAALTQNTDWVRTTFAVPDSALILPVERWAALNNTSANLLIGYVREGDTILLDEVQYNAKWHHTLIRNPRGVSLERINPHMPSQDPNTWHSAASEVHYGTPGYQNSQYRALAYEPSLQKNWFFPEPEAFTPDNDGHNDVCFIRYTTEAEGFVVNILILNSVGVKVTQLVSNQLLGSEGYFVWDGKTDRNINVNPGVYVLYIELINPNTGVKKNEKMPIVVSAR